jgi:hypothetical protein
MAEVSWNEFVRVWREKEGRGLTYGQSMVAAGPIWHDPVLKAEFINKHIRPTGAEEAKHEEEVKSPSLPTPLQSVPGSVPTPAAKASSSSTARDLEYYRIKAKYYKRKAAK